MGLAGSILVRGHENPCLGTAVLFGLDADSTCNARTHAAGVDRELDQRPGCSEQSEGDLLPISRSRDMQNALLDRQFKVLCRAQTGFWDLLHRQGHRESCQTGAFICSLLTLLFS